MRAGKDVVLVVDVSGSMQSAMKTVKDTITLVKKSLHDEDRIAIVEFGDVGKVLLPLSPPNLPTIDGIIEALTTVCTTIK